ncbi:RNA-binding S4 domain-containing protein [Garciella nitratireducens]|uniref:Ribosome-associated protein n=1 Tax=Garciella nitratireducens DSM 15102 TaxID=1121911 RepID=A0A1T4PDK9_9FIRM|nr:RNA-binding S4 domain-containing protein [Garciella nitratireducens]RBP36150.1 ribosome-associated protein [Garciella nitratireducens]SJZ89316.1 ribosome-associated protein [Garciella nitratireducens DSM 15102]
MEKVKITTPYIKLDQLLKFINVAENGGMAKVMIKEGVVKVNGEIIFQRGKKIKPGDIVEIQDYDTIKVE